MQKKYVIAVASGKGGTGKTTVATNLFLSADENMQLLDCDVEEPNSHLFLAQTAVVEEPVSVLVPQIDESQCSGCKRCQDVCEFNALAVIGKQVMVFEELCHSCGACVYLCPEKCISEKAKQIGTINKSRVDGRPFAYGTLGIGEIMAPPLIRAVRDARALDRDCIVDAPPGAACPMVSAVKEVDYCILVTEPTPFGMHDLEIAVKVLREMHIPLGVIINRHGLGDAPVEQFCQDRDIPILMKIPFDRRIAESYSRGVPIVTALPEYTEKFRAVLQTVMNRGGAA